ncbi:hypothetical protein [Oceanobacillus sp. CFH 90083]|uniref:hypothetical protein n=1 Tax=Oceanobacillus sp. CFH 90083 TaxID=2592336 RepID=UPI00128D66DA|nr:hypothetical protein [Oceanobacillus sp. CFH 90083]
MYKRIYSFIVAIVMMFTLSVSVSVSAEDTTFMSDDTISIFATNYFSGSTGTMNSLYGNESTLFNISSGTTPSLAKVSGVTLNVNVSSGSAPFYLNVKHPDGSVVQHYITGTGNKSVTFDQFNHTDPYGTWKVSITTTGIVSTATARMTVNYTY